MTRRQKYAVCLGANGERCAELVPKGTGRCRKHRAANDRRYVRIGDDVYRSKRWQGVRRTVLRDNPWCAWPDGCKELAVDVDHAIPVGETDDPYDVANLRGLCKHHHGVVTMREMRDRGAI